MNINNTNGNNINTTMESSLNKDKLNFLHNLLDKELEIIKEVSPYKNTNNISNNNLLNSNSNNNIMNNNSSINNNYMNNYSNNSD